MPKINLRSFIEEASKLGEIKQVKKPLNPRFEVSAVLEKLERANHYPALLFKNVEGSDMPVLSNLFATRRRLALALNCDENSLNEVYRKGEGNLTKPVLIPKGPVQEMIINKEEINLYDFPLLTHNEKDAGPYITMGAMVIKDPDTGIRNIGIYRNMLHGKNKLGIHMAEVSHINYIYEKYCQRGKRMPVAITLGHHPAFYLGILSFVPLGVDEYEVVGGITGQPLELVKCQTVDLEVPAEAEIVLEGYIQPGEERLEAPFGDYTTLYGKAILGPVVTVETIMRRKDAIYLDCFSGHRDLMLLGGTPRLSTIYKTIQATCSTVIDVFMPISGCCRMICYVKIKKRHEGEAKNVIAAVIAADPFVKYVVVVDEDVNIFDEEAVIRAIATRLIPKENVFVIPNAKGSPLDPVAVDHFLVTKVGIDATKPLIGFPEGVKVPGSEEVDLDGLLSDL